MKLQFPIKNTRDYMSSAVVLSAFSQEGNIFSTCCSNGEVLLDSLKVIITVSFCLASLTNC